MAVAGSATTAYRVRLVDGKAAITPTTAIAHICATPSEAMQVLDDGEAVTVAGADMWQLQQALKARGIEVRQ